MIDKRATEELHKLQKTFKQHGVPAVFITHDDVEVSHDMMAPDGEETLCGFYAGIRGDLTRPAARRAAVSYKKLVAKYPKAIILVLVAGYDDDPREVPDIPEVAQHLRRWARSAGFRSVRDAIASPLHPTSVGLLAKAGCWPDEIDPSDVPVVPITDL